MIQFDEHIFQGGWNHQPAMGFDGQFIATKPPRSSQKVV